MRRAALDLALVVAMTLGAGRASAQHALGDGRGLERDLRANGTGQAPREDYGAIVRYRNAVVTGQVPGGSHLRVNVGYTDSSDFTSRLGSDDLYTFRRDSLYSGLGGLGFRGTESLQFQFSQSTGNTRRTADPYLLQRLGGLTPATGADRQAPSPVSKFQFAEAARSGTLRSTSAYSANRSLQPVVIGYRSMRGEEEPVASSSLLGIKGYAPRPYDAPKEEETKPATPPGEQSAAPKSAGPEVAKTAHEELRERLQSLAPQLVKPEAGTPIPEATKPEAEPSGTKPEAKPGTKPGATPDTRPERQPSGALPRPDDNPPPTKPGEKPEPPTTKPAADDRSQPLGSDWQRRVNELRDALKPLRQGNAKDKDEKVDPYSRKIDKDTLAVLRRAGDEQTKAYIAAARAGATPARDPFQTAMENGQKFLKTERYFDSEERFAFALVLKSGDATAQAGRIHAQLGSGLFVSAAANLRRLIEENPDVTGMRYSIDLLPSLQRQRELLAQLRQNVSGSEPASLRVPRESALLLAYLGYQRNEPATVREGLDAFRRQVPKEDLAFVELLEGVWAKTASDHK